MRSTAKTMVMVIAVLALLASACSSAADKISEQAAEQLAEQLIESGSDGDVSVDVSGSGDDVTIEMETEEGSISIGSGAKMPDGLDIPVPDGGDIQSSFTADDAVQVSLAYDRGRFDEIVGFFEAWTDGTGDEWDTQSMNVSGDEGDMRTKMWVSADGEDMIFVSDCAAMGSDDTEFNATCVSVTQGM